LKYLLNRIRYLSSSWLVSRPQRDNNSSLTCSSPCPFQGLSRQKLVQLATFTIPILMISTVAEPAAAWQKKPSVGDPSELDSVSPELTIQPVMYHQIRPGDTLWELAQAYNVSAQALAEQNQMTTQQLLQIGDTLEIPLRDNLPQPDPQLLTFPVGAIGGAISSDNLALESLTEETSISPVPRVIHSGKLAAATESESGSSELPIQEFLADVQQLRANYEKEPVEALDTLNQDWDTNPASDHQGKVFSPVESTPNSASPNQNSLATAPIKVEFYNPSLSAPIGETVSPELPPLSSPEQYLPNHPQKFDGYIWPAEGVFTSGYGMRWGRMHRGIDIAAPIGTPILAAAPGEVVVAGWSNGGYGNLVKLKHPDGSLTLYAHNNKVLVRKGQEVDQGQQIAEMGSTGRSTGPHLHFEIHPAGKGAKNPLAYLPKR